MADLVRRRRQIKGSANASPHGLIELTLLLAAGGGLALALWRLTGVPTIPSTFPGWKRIGDILSGSYLPYEGLISAVAVLAWLALAYLGAAVVLRLLCEMALRLSDGSSWARAAH